LYRGGDLLLDGRLEARERCRERVDGLEERLAAVGHAGAPVVVDDVLGNDLGEGAGIPRGERLGETPNDLLRLV
jgi:hypothetical protein